MLDIKHRVDQSLFPHEAYGCYGRRQTINKKNKLYGVLSSDMINAKEKVKGKTDTNVSGIGL